MSRDPLTVEDQLIVTLWHDPSLLISIPYLSEQHFPTWAAVFKVIKDAFLNNYRPQISLLPSTLQMAFAELLDKVPPLEGVEAVVCAETLVKQFMLNSLKRLGEWLVKKSGNSAEPSYLISAVGRYIEELVKGSGLEFDSFDALIDDYLKWLKGEGTDEVVGEFGIKELDERVGGIRSGMLVTCLAPTSGGKTSFAVQTSIKSALKGYPVAFFSLEMTEQQLMTRFIAHLTSLPSFALWTKQIGKDPQDLEKIETLKSHGLNIYIAKDVWTLDDILKAIVTAKLRFNCRLIVVDYLQKIVVPQQERRELEVALVAKELKRYALQHGVAVLALSQVNTEKEGRARESRVIEHESDVLLFLRGDELDRIKIEVRKNRMGQRGAPITVKFNAELCLFDDSISANEEVF